MRSSYRILKFPLEVAPLQRLVLPIRRKFLSIQIQHGVPQIWFLCEDTSINETVAVAMVVTGQEFTRAIGYLGTVQLDGGALVLHVFADPGEAMEARSQ